MIKITLLETNRVHIQIDEKTVQVGTDRIGYTVVQGTSTAKVQVDYGETYKSWNKSVIMTNAQGRSIRKPLDGMYATFEFDLPIEMTIAPYTKLLFQATKGDQVQRWTIVDIPIARTAEGQMPPIPSTDAEEIRGIAENAEKIAKDALEEAARSGTSVIEGGVPQTTWDADKKLDKTESTLQFNQLLKPNIYRTRTNVGLTITNNNDGSFSVTGTATSSEGVYITNDLGIYQSGHIYYVSFNSKRGFKLYPGGYGYDGPAIVKQNFTVMGLSAVKDTTYNDTIFPIIIDLTTMFGAGNEPQTVEEVQKYIPAGTYYPYREPVNKAELTELASKVQTNATEIGNLKAKPLPNFVELNRAGQSKIFILATNFEVTNIYDGETLLYTLPSTSMNITISQYYDHCFIEAYCVPQKKQIFQVYTSVKGNIKIDTSHMYGKYVKIGG